MAPPHEKPTFRVEAALPAPAKSYFLERDSAAFRSLLSKVGLSEAFRNQPPPVRRLVSPPVGSRPPPAAALWLLVHSSKPSLPLLLLQMLKIGQLEFNDL